MWTDSTDCAEEDTKTMRTPATRAVRAALSWEASLKACPRSRGGKGLNLIGLSSGHVASTCSTSTSASRFMSTCRSSSAWSMGVGDDEQGVFDGSLGANLGLRCINVCSTGHGGALCVAPLLACSSDTKGFSLIVWVVG